MTQLKLMTMGWVFLFILLSNCLFSQSSPIPVFTAGNFGSSAWRIPALAVAGDTLIALADARRNGNGDLPNNIDIIARTSTDGGVSWSEPVVVADFGESGASDPAIVYHQNSGQVVCLFASHKGLFQSTPSDRIRIQMSRSNNGGRFWSVPRDISAQIYQEGWHAAWVASGTIHMTPTGRLMAAIGVRETAAATISNFMIYSDDQGTHWQTAPGRACIGGDEAKMMTLRDGKVLMLIRSRGQRKAVYSNDQGLTWTAPQDVPALVEPAVNGDLIRHCYPSIKGRNSEGPLLFSIASHPSERRNMTVFVSYDEGLSWNQERIVFSGASAYSALAVLSDGSIGILYENGEKNQYDLVFERFFLSGGEK